MISDTSGKSAYPEPNTLYQFLIDGYQSPFGHLIDKVADRFSWGEDWVVDHSARTVTLMGGDTLSRRNEIMHRTLISEREMGTFKDLQGWTNELFPVYGPNKELVVSIERAAAPLFGVLTYGVQLLAYQETPEGNISGVWIARRAKTKRTYPGMLDSTVGGCLPTGESPFECLIRECAEEASFSADLVRKHAVAVGAVSYVGISDERGGGELGLLCPEVQFIYEMKLPDDVVPVPGENEVEEIKLFSVEELKDALGRGEFTPANGCIILDFFVRHGIITFETEPNYIEIAVRLHRRHDLLTA